MISAFRARSRLGRALQHRRDRRYIRAKLDFLRSETRSFAATEALEAAGPDADVDQVTRRFQEILSGATSEAPHQPPEEPSSAATRGAAKQAPAPLDQARRYIREELDLRRRVANSTAAARAIKELGADADVDQIASRYQELLAEAEQQQETDP